LLTQLRITLTFPLWAKAKPLTNHCRTLTIISAYVLTWC